MMKEVLTEQRVFKRREGVLISFTFKESSPAVSSSDSEEAKGGEMDERRRQ